MNKKHSRRRFFSAVLALVLVLIPFTAASADGPIFLGPFQETGVAPIADCGDFEVLDYYEINWTRTRFVNDLGQTMWFLEHVWGTDTFVNSVTGEAYPTTFTNNSKVEIRPERGGQSTGIGFKFVLPGEGVVFLDVGRVVLDENFEVVFVAGPHDPLDGDFDKLCEVMA